jgi:hypothetical protein
LFKNAKKFTKTAISFTIVVAKSLESLVSKWFDKHSLEQKKVIENT